MPESHRLAHWLMRPSGTSFYPREEWWRLAVSHRALVVFGHAPSLDRPNLRKLAGPEGFAPSRSDLETNPSAWTSRACDARGRYRAGSVCLEGRRASMNTSRANWWSWTVTLRLVRVAGAACCYYHHSPGKMDTTAGIAPAVTPALQAGPFAARARRENPRLRSLGAGRLLRASALNDHG